MKECKYEGCGRKVSCKGLCHSHYQMLRKGEALRPIGLLTKMKSGYSTERFCKHCGETKDWKKYYLEGNMCRDCWREHLTAEYDLITGRRV